MERCCMHIRDGIGGYICPYCDKMVKRGEPVKCLYDGRTAKTLAELAAKCPFLQTDTIGEK